MCSFSSSGVEDDRGCRFFVVFRGFDSSEPEVRVIEMLVPLAIAVRARFVHPVHYP
jgi:hypothetical protein